jgi:hypothetical protein
MGKIQKQFTIYERANFEDRDSTIKRTDVAASNAETVFNELVAAINNNKADAFSKTLSSDFIYPGDGLKEGDKDFTSGSFDPVLFLGVDASYIAASFIGVSASAMVADTQNQVRHNHATRDNNYSETYTGNHHTRHMKYRYYSVRPVIENLFFENNELFRRLASQVALSESQLIHNIFAEAFNGTDLPSDIMTPWDAIRTNEVRLGVIEISLYGHQLVSEGIARGHSAIQLATELDTQLDTLPLIDDSNTAKVKWLDYKLKFVEHLHSQDSHFAGHRGWKRVIGNIASIIFSAGILNLINFAVTGNFLFFNKTRTQCLVKDVDHTIEPARIVLSH